VVVAVEIVTPLMSAFVHCTAAAAAAAAAAAVALSAVQEELRIVLAEAVALLQRYVADVAVAPSTALVVVAVAAAVTCGRQ